MELQQGPLLHLTSKLVSLNLIGIRIEEFRNQPITNCI